MTDKHMLPIFVSAEYASSPRRPVSPGEAIDAIAEHCLLLDPDVSPGLIRIALQMFAAQALAFYGNGQDMVRAGIFSHYTEEQRRMRPTELLIHALQEASFPQEQVTEAERARLAEAEDLRHHRMHDRGEPTAEPEAA
jgi:hypothetical protein